LASLRRNKLSREPNTDRYLDPPEDEEDEEECELSRREGSFKEKLSARDLSKKDQDYLADKAEDAWMRWRGM